MEVKIFLGSDHAGFALKEHIKNFLSDTYTVSDQGCISAESCDYPIFAKSVARCLVANNGFGILCCYTGIGMSIQANRFLGIRAALCYNKESAVLSRLHNNANVLCLGSAWIQISEVNEIVRSFLESKFSVEARHVNRVEMLSNMEG
ncbi:MAG: ribose 5-phosphate isomerase B [Candidatus Xenolissoclinum pacificiensis L6]|uniref:Ribose 5-phosphate isomerase B n=1 Tax=Candidatus Xenolissoclinum pacificiensis L6 TaxID=1401685 RepID=W2UZL0_9RICK|nr:MAG: ribose 5-phosphate isomerase B [Candidatus Xenolissoclinum pacificiensis L6]